MILEGFVLGLGKGKVISSIFFELVLRSEKSFIEFFNFLSRWIIRVRLGVGKV